MRFRLPRFAGESRRMAVAFGLFAALAMAGCEGSEGGAGEDVQKFEKPNTPEFNKAPTGGSGLISRTKSRKDEIQEDRETTNRKKGSKR